MDIFPTNHHNSTMNQSFWKSIQVDFKFVSKEDICLTSHHVPCCIGKLCCPILIKKGGTCLSYTKDILYKPAEIICNGETTASFFLVMYFVIDSYFQRVSCWLVYFPDCFPLSSDMLFLFCRKRTCCYKSQKGKEGLTHGKDY